MWRYRTVAIVLMVIVGPLVESCGEVVYFNIEDFNIRTAPHPSQSDNPPSVVTPVRLSEVAFRVEIRTERIASIKGGGFNATAYNIEHEYMQTVKSVIITSSASLGGIAAGESLNSLFIVDHYSAEKQVESIVGMNPLPRFSFRSTETVTSPQQHVFTFRFELDDGRVFEPKSAQLELIP